MVQNMKNTYIKILILIFISISIAQEKQNDGIYLSGFLGAQSSSEGINRYYNGGSSLFFGAGLGIPIFSNISLVGRISYISKSDYDAFFDPRYIDQSLEITNNLASVNASISQLIFNGGIQYKIFLIEGINLGLLGGLTYGIIDHEAKLTNSFIVQQIDNEGMFGFFGGANIEKDFEDSDFTLYAEAIYNKINNDVIYFRDAFSGMNFTFGFRYYFTNSR